MARIPTRAKNGLQKIIPDIQSIPTNLSSALLCCDSRYFVFFTDHLKGSSKSPNMSISNGQNPSTGFVIKISFFLQKNVKVIMLEICDLGNCKIDCKGCHDYFEAFNCITKNLKMSCA